MDYQFVVVMKEKNRAALWILLISGFRLDSPLVYWTEPDSGCGCMLIEPCILRELKKEQETRNMDESLES